MEQPVPERFWTPKQIADRWHVSTDTVVRVFEQEPDILILGQPISHQKRRYRTIRIPHHVLVRVEKRRSLVNIDNMIYTAGHS
jgi:hypothetical protein